MASIKELLERLRSELDTLATAIRAKTGKTDNLDLTEMATEQDAVFEAGKKAEYDQNWGALKDVTYLTYAFAGHYWTDNTFKPTFDLKPVGIASGMFRTNKIKNLKKCLEDAGVTLDTSAVTQASTMFGYSSQNTAVPKLDLSASTSNNEIFSGATLLETIEEIKVSPNATFSNAFKGCTNLTNMTVTGVIGQNGFNVSTSTKLTHDSLMSIINCLEAKTSGTWTVTLGTTNLAKLTDSEKAIATQKGWTLA